MPAPRGLHHRRLLRAETIVSALAVLTAVAVASPVVSIFLTALQPVPELWPHLFNYVLPQALWDTALLLVGVGIVTLSAGAGTAWLVSSFDFAGRSHLLWLLPLPLAIPTYIGAYVYADIFEPLGIAQRVLATWMPMGDAAKLLPSMRSLPGAIFVLGLVLYPYVYLSARAMFQVQSAEFIEAAKTLGAGRWRTFWSVSLPMARPALAIGLALALLETLNDIGASEYLGIRTLTVAVFTTWHNRSSLPGAAQIACLILLIVALLIAMERYGRRDRAFTLSAESPQLVHRRQLHGARAFAAYLLCLLPAICGFAIPFAYLVYQCIKRGLFGHFDAAIARDLFHSVVFATLATSIAILLGFAIQTANRWRLGALEKMCIAAARSGYALPGLVLALGLLAPVLAIDHAINGIARWAGLPAPGLVLVGSGAAIVIAYVVRFIAVPTGFIQAGFERIPFDYDDSARVSGAGQIVTVRRIHLPLLNPALWGAAIVVFVDCLKELPATLLLRPLNVETLSTSIYQFASRGSFEEGSLAALLIVAASVGPVVWLTRFADVPSGPA